MTPDGRSRARTVVVIAAVAAGLFAVTDAALYFRLRSRMEALERQGALLAEMETIASEVGGVRAHSARAILPEGRTLDPAEITRLAKAHRLGEGLTATAPNSVELGEGLREQLLDMDFESITREDLARFLDSVEGLDPGILTKTLSIRPKSGQTELVNAHVQFSGYVKTSPST